MRWNIEVVALAAKSFVIYGPPNGDRLGDFEFLEITPDETERIWHVVCRYSYKGKPRKAILELDDGAISWPYVKSYRVQE